MTVDRLWRLSACQQTGGQAQARRMGKEGSILCTWGFPSPEGSDVPIGLKEWKGGLPSRNMCSDFATFRGYGGSEGEAITPLRTHDRGVLCWGPHRRRLVARLRCYISAGSGNTSYWVGEAQQEGGRGLGLRQAASAACKTSPSPRPTDTSRGATAQTRYNCVLLMHLND